MDPMDMRATIDAFEREAASATFDAVANDAVTEATRTMNDRLEKEIVGAWRAGYDQLHVYDGAALGAKDVADTFAMTMYLLPGHDGHGRPDPPDMIYRYSYDLSDMTRELARKALS